MSLAMSLAFMRSWWTPEPIPVVLSGENLLEWSQAVQHLQHLGLKEVVREVDVPDGVQLCSVDEGDQVIVLDCVKVLSAPFPCGVL